MIKIFRVAGSVRLAAMLALLGAISHPLRATACAATSDCAFDSSLGCGTVTCNHSSGKCEFTGDPSLGQPCKTAAQKDGTTICAVSSSGGHTTMSLQCQPTLCAPGAQGQSWNACTTADQAIGTWTCMVGPGTASYQWICQADPSLCVPGKTECSGSGTHTCSTSGTWGAITACPTSAPQCVGGACQCQCQDGDTRCNAAGTGQQTCSGCQWGAETSCASGICGGNRCQTCPTCPAGQTCHTCPNCPMCPVCTDGATTCVGTKVRRLCVNGQWTEQTCPGICSAGQCRPLTCNPPCVFPRQCMNGQCRPPTHPACFPACKLPSFCLDGECVERGDDCPKPCSGGLICVNSHCVKINLDQ